MNELFDRLEKQIQSIEESFKKEMSSVRANRPTVGLIEDVKVSYYDQMVPLKHLGSVGIVPPREIHIQVWDTVAVAAVAKAIDSASLGFSVSVDGTVVRAFLPELSEERREELVRHIKKILEQYRIQIRHTRDEMNKETDRMFDAGEIGEDERFRGRERIQKIIDSANEIIERMCEAKIKEIQE